MAQILRYSKFEEAIYQYTIPYISMFYETIKKITIFNFKPVFPIKITSYVILGILITIKELKKLYIF